MTGSEVLKMASKDNAITEAEAARDKAVAEAEAAAEEAPKVKDLPSK